MRTVVEPSSLPPSGATATALPSSPAQALYLSVCVPARGGHCQVNVRVLVRRHRAERPGPDERRVGALGRLVDDPDRPAASATYGLAILVLRPSIVIARFGIVSSPALRTLILSEEVWPIP